jgi:N-acetylglutamate synthase
MLRASGGPTRRTNSVNPLHAEDPAGLVDQVCSLYARVGQSPLFRIPDLIEHRAEDLDRMGFVPEGRTVTLAKSPVMAPSMNTTAVSLTTSADTGWFAAWRALRPDLDAAAVAAVRRSVDALMVPTAFACRRVDGQPVAVAYAALHDGIAVLESMVTHAAHRGRGHARAVVDRLVGWSSAAGAEIFALQVEASNAPARALYASAGITQELYGYHYRRAPM